ncbi:MAG: helix-turn-helix domain-containing protein [Bacteroides sp.]|jgi:AraC-like DNA-binding protein|nr:helix-turn-helix domain-containing protein [Bacteroides sp.]
MLLFFSILGIFLSVLLLSFNARRNTTTHYLGSFFFLLSLYMLAQWGLLYSKSVPVVTGLLASFSLVFPPLYLTGPMLFWYVRSVLNDQNKLSKRDLWHLLPMLIYFLAGLPFTFTVPLSEKAAIAREVVSNVGVMQAYALTFLSRFFGVADIYLSRPLLVLGYTLWSMGLIARYYSQNKLKGVFKSQYFMLKFLVLLTGLVFLMSTTHIILIIDTFKLDFSEISFGVNLVRIISILGLTGLLISPFLFPEILYGLPRMPVSRNKDLKETDNIQDEETKKSPVHFEKQYLELIERRMDELMENDQPYLSTDFNINQLAVQIGVPVHHLAYYFREVRKETFSDYRNKWRVKHAKKLIEEGKTSQLTLEAIATLAGFSNRNSFRSVFQKIEGICPSTFALQFKEAE